MNKNFFKKFSAFTMAEMMICLSVIGFIAGITVHRTVNSEKFKAQKLKSSTRIFYDDIEKAYQSVLTYDTNEFNILNLKNTDNSSAAARSEKMRELFTEDMDLVDVDCARLPDMSWIIPATNTNLRCSSSDKGFYVIFDMLNNCNSQKCYKYEYFRDDLDEIGTPDTMETDATITNNSSCCGHIYYIDKHQRNVSMTDVGRYVFMVPFAKREIYYH